MPPPERGFCPPTRFTIEVNRITQVSLPRSLASAPPTKVGANHAALKRILEEDLQAAENQKEYET